MSDSNNMCAMQACDCIEYERIYAGVVQLTQEAGNRAISHSNNISNLVLENGYEYALYIYSSGPVEIEDYSEGGSTPGNASLVGSAIVGTAIVGGSGGDDAEGNIVAGPVKIGCLTITIVTSDDGSVVTIENNVMIGYNHADAPIEVAMRVDKILS